LLVPAPDREGVVRAIEEKITGMYGTHPREPTPPRDNAPQSFDVVHPPTQREGFVEQVVTTYERVEPAAQDQDVPLRKKRTRRNGA
jgi:hypothetical protein